MIRNQPESTSAASVGRYRTRGFRDDTGPRKVVDANRSYRDER